MSEISNFLLGRLLCAHFFDLIFTFIAASNNTAWGSLGNFYVQCIFRKGWAH